MTVWTKGFVATRNKSPFFAAALVERALNRLIGPFSQVRIDNQGRTPDEPYSRQVSLRMNPSTKGIDFSFTYQGERRELTMFFGVDNDRKEYTDSSISLLIGCWGSSKLFMKAAMNALRPLGEVWFLASDASDAPFEKLDIPPMSYLEACRQRLVMPSCLSLKDWVDEFRTGTLGATTEQDVFGFTLEEALSIGAMSYADSCERIKELAGLVTDESKA